MPLQRKWTHSALYVALLCLAALVTSLTPSTGKHSPTFRMSSGSQRPFVAARAAATSPRPCLDIPVSSALVIPQSCWQTGPTSLIVAGVAPSNPQSGVVDVIEGQSEGLSTLPGSGPLTVAFANGTGACIDDTHGAHWTVSLQNGALRPTTASACGKSAVSAAASLSRHGTLPSVPQSADQVGALVGPPTDTPSYYEYDSYANGQCGPTATSGCPIYVQGYNTYTPASQGLVILDFGAPCYVPGTTTYGAQLFGGDVCVTDAQVGALASRWVAGYEASHGSSTAPLTLAIGTSNSLTGVDPNYALNNTQLAASGAAWYSHVVASLASSGLRAPITPWGASDIEESSSGNWYAASPTLSWVGGYSGASSARYSCSLTTVGFLADYGDDIFGGTGSGDGWTAADVYQAAWGTPAACADPEIYYTGMAGEWASLSQWGSQSSPSGAIQFTGVMAEAVSGSYSPTQAWESLQSATLQSPSIPTLTDIGTALQGNAPQVDAVSPSSGPVNGGTQVTISGRNLTGVVAVYFGSSPAQSFSANNGVVSATSPSGSAGFVDVTVETSFGTSSASGTDGFVFTASAAYNPITPTRIEDTRPGSGEQGSGAAPGPQGTLDVPVAGVKGIPSSGVTSVLVNLTVTAPTATGYVTAMPAGVALPPTSTIDYTPGETKANMVDVALGRNGEIAIYNQFGTTQIIVDVEGWYTSSGSSGAGAFVPVPSKRIADTRAGSGYQDAGQTVGPGQAVTVQVGGVGGVPLSGASSVAFNLTETGATQVSYLEAFPTGISQPTASNLNFVPGVTSANEVVVPIGASGQVSIYNASGNVNVIVDLEGWFTTGASSASGQGYFTALGPTRVADTRPNSGQAYAGMTLAPYGQLTVTFAGVNGLPAAANIVAAVCNVTVTDTTMPGYLQGWAAGTSDPGTSIVNWNTGETNENAVTLQVNSAGQAVFENGSAGTVDIIVDVSGWYGPSA